MARIVTKSRHRDVNGMRIQPAELFVMIAVIIALIWGIRYYFMVYRNSPGYTLSQFMGYVKAGNVSEQYDLLDASDKKIFPTQKTYENQMPMARGYTARIEDVKVVKETPDPKNAGLVRLDVELMIRGGAASTGGGLKGLAATESNNVKDQYVMRKNEKGQWKVWLEKSKRKLTEIPPSPPGDPINGG